MPPSKTDPNEERTIWTDKELMAVKFKPIEYLIPKYMPNGLLLLVGRPFSGKSWLAIQAANAINRGGLFFGERAKQGRILYLYLETRNADLQERMKAIGWEATGKVDIRTEWPRFKKGGLEQLKKQIKDGSYRFVIIDTLYKLLSGSKNERDGELEPMASELHTLCKTGYVDAMMVLHHSNKMSVTMGEAGEAAISGDTSLAGVADSFWMLYKRPQSTQMNFLAQGRKIRQYDFPVKFDDKSCTWQIITKQNAIKPDSIRGLILEQFACQPMPLSASKVAELIHKPIPLVTREINMLASETLLIRLPRQGVEVFYQLPVSDGNGNGHKKLSFLQ